MNLSKIHILSLGLLLVSVPVVAQQSTTPKKPAAPQGAASPAPAQQAKQPADGTKPDRAAAYYHFSLGHMY
jgi:hypothetical protein